ncbi:MAG: YggU family protein, partial [Planctomycetaceae bacterium]|nr:YggU family protein [Planctomycetaceae bacterium]
RDIERPLLLKKLCLPMPGGSMSTPESISTPEFVSASDKGWVIHLHVQPKARRDQIVGVHDGRLKVAVSAPPDKGKANDAVLALVADTLQVPGSQVSLLRGATNRRKDILVSGLTDSTRLQTLSAADRE